MPAKERVKTRYPGVYSIEGTGPDGKPDRIYYVFGRKRSAGKTIRFEEPAGWQSKDDMTAAKANQIRIAIIKGERPTRPENRARVKAEREAATWTFNRLWETYKQNRPFNKGLRTDENRYALHVKPVFGNKEPKDLVPLDLDRLRIRLTKAGKSLQTVAHVLGLVKRLSNFAQKKAICPGLRFKPEMPKVSNAKIEDLTGEQLKALLDAIDKSNDIQAANMMKLALFSGLRRGEMFKLKWDHIDFEKGFILLVDPKGGRDITIPLNESARRVLEYHPRISEYVFPGRSGGRRVDIHKQVNRIKEAAGLPHNFRALHGLRHVFGSSLVSAGVDLYAVQALLGHKDPRPTQRYSHLKPGTLQKASGLMTEIVNSILSRKEAEVIPLNK